MNTGIYNIDEAQINKLIDMLNIQKAKAGSLINILNEIQNDFGPLSIEVQKVISKVLEIPLGQVASVVSFYTFLRTENHGKYFLYMCESAPCQLKEAQQTLKKVEEILGIKTGETTLDGKFTLETCECLGVCNRSPAVMVNGEIYGPIQAGDVEHFLKRFE